jgi:ubiquinone/menaquinone biosynthesis C-methylase UbiE
MNLVVRVAGDRRGNQLQGDAVAMTDYVLGGNDAEHERLMRQAQTLAPFTERLFRDAGIVSGQRVLDVGSGVGDVALLAASLVGKTGSVLGIDRDAMALDKARSRAAAARAGNIQFLETDLSQMRIDGDFDAIVGRFILMFLPDPAATLRSLTAHLRPGGVLVFHEVSWASFYALAGHLPLRTACADLICTTLRRAGARPDMQLTLYQGLLESGYQAPNLRMEVPVANDAGSHGWLPELIASLRPRFKEFRMETHAVGEFGTLSARLELERENARSFAPLVGLVGAWARKAA